MMKRVLVPLDTTEAAEEILPLVTMLAGAGASVRLVHVAPAPENVMTLDGRTIAYADQEASRMAANWIDYLYAVKGRLGVEVEDVIRFGDPASEIVAEAEAFGADTIALSTSTSCGLKRALLGSVAEAILRRAPIGVLLYRHANAV